MPVSDSKLIALWLKVDVTGACVERLHHDVVDDADGEGHFVSSHFSGLSCFSDDQSEALCGAPVALCWFHGLFSAAVERADALEFTRQCFE